MDKNTFFNLIDKYLNGTASPQEKSLIEEYYSRLEKMGTTNLFDQEKAILKQDIYNTIQHKLTATIPSIEKEKHPFVRTMFSWRSVAAAILLFLATGSYLIFFNNNRLAKQQSKTVDQKSADRLPGYNAAILTLAGGRKIILDSASGTISKQGGATVINMKGLLSYLPSTGELQGETVYNTITTARGNQYQLVLADGSKVWLNSATLLRFPTSFNGKERTVELDGEAYFEVAHNPSKPFHVLVSSSSNGSISRKGLDVQVLGTHFNVNSFKDEDDIKTTLLEGSVKVITTEKTALLKPGEQAIGNSSSLYIAGNVDIDKIMAWKNGWFEFDDTNLATVMRQISRWYDVDIIFEGKTGSEKFGGRISKNLPLSNVLKMLEESGVRFRLEEKKLIVIP